MQGLVWGLVAVLFVLHQDVWFWEDDRLVFGFLPIGLVYHAGLSVAASFVWLLAVRFAWPEGLEHRTLSRASGTSTSEGGPSA